jgi:crotonobetainyl-CoA:carnitine CoA-transferase CaiB-like acyl-CoA transferase
VDDADLGSVRMQGVIPRFANHPGGVWRTGPSLGADDRFVYRGYLGLSEEEFERLRSDGVIGRRHDG